MITAKNYAAQAEKGLSELKKIFLTDADKESLDKCFISNIPLAVHFALPDGGVIFNDEKKGIAGETIRLPFEKITLEYYMQFKQEIDKHTSSKRLIYAFEINREDAKIMYPSNIFSELAGDTWIVVYSAFYFDLEKRWEMNPIGWAMPTKWDLSFPDSNLINKDSKNLTNLRICGEPVPLCNDLLNEYSKIDGNKTILALLDEVTAEVSAVLELCEALSCTNVKHTILEPINISINNKRIAKGKLPFYETKILTIDTVNTYGLSTDKNITLDRNSPRQHLRRGHIRKLQTGKKVWVNSAVIGNTKNGILHKDYAIN